MSTLPKQILIVAQAPVKPALGESCNGCGVCCLLEPCPLGVLLSGYRHGRCQALRWQAEVGLYRCGAMTVPRDVLGERLPQVLRPAMPLLARALGVMAGRWVAVGTGCDCDAELADDVPPNELS
jgi:hypothetical protein